MDSKTVIWVLSSIAALAGSATMTKGVILLLVKQKPKKVRPKTLKAMSTITFKRYLKFMVFGTLLTLLATGSPALAAIGGFFCVLLIHLTKQSESSALHDQLLEGWPGVIDEVRIRVCTLGEAIPHALFSASNGFGEKVSSIFDRSRITWNLTGDFSLVCNLIADELADPKSTAVLQTMVLLHELASTSTESRLTRLRDDRSWDLAAAKETKAAMAGAIFARRFVLLVPIGMALAGAAIGGGRSSFQTPAGISLSAFALGLLLLCWIWSTRLIGLPKVKRGRFEDDESTPDRPADESVSDLANSSWGR